jgi:hypothetical protein
MLHLNTIFEAEDLDPSRIQLVRHKDPRFQKEGKTVFDVWSSEIERFEKYQSIQSRKNTFDEGGLVASFIVSNSDETLFVGLYTVASRRAWTTTDYCDPRWKRPSETRDFVHDLRLTTDMRDYKCRLVIKPWRDAINIVKKTVSCNPEVIEIKRAPDQEQFPSFMKFRKRVANLPSIPQPWIERLKEAKGIYLLTFDDGQQYVGSASGDDGFWQRWSDYVRIGHGGNRILIREKRDAREADVSILEVTGVTGSGLTRPEIIACEMNWQAKLGSKAKRLDDE